MLIEADPMVTEKIAKEFKRPVPANMLSSHSTCIELIENILSIYRCLKNRSSLAPSNEINHLFSQLVTMSKLSLSESETIAVLEADDICDRISELRNICRIGEFQLEKFWAEMILSSKAPITTLRKFPYMNNYQELSRLESTAIKHCKADTTSVAFVGGGPLPLTAYFLSQDHHLHVTVLDKDEEAIKLSSQVFSYINEKTVSFIHANAKSYLYYDRFDVVILASLVGESTRDKKRISHWLYHHMKPDSLLLIRSAHKLRKLLYPAIDESLLPHFKPEMTIHPHNDIVNSIILAKRI